MSTPKEQIRASIAMTHAMAIAERLLQADKSNPAFRLSDLRDDNERGIYVDAAASFLLDQAGRVERAHLLNVCRGHAHAIDCHEQEDARLQARKDRAEFGDPLVQAFMTTSPNYCGLCKEPLRTNAVDVMLTENLKGRAHGSCCAQNDHRFEFINEFTYKLLEVR